MQCTRRFQNVFLQKKHSMRIIVIFKPHHYPWSTGCKKLASSSSRLDVRLFKYRSVFVWSTNYLALCPPTEAQICKIITSLMHFVWNTNLHNSETNLFSNNDSEFINTITRSYGVIILCRLWLQETMHRHSRDLSESPSMSHWFWLKKKIVQ